MELPFRPGALFEGSECAGGERLPQAVRDRTGGRGQQVRQGLNRRVVLGLPGGVIGPIERTPVVDLDREALFTAGAGGEPEPGIAGAAAGQDGHHRPVTPPEDPGKGFFIDRTRLG